MPQKQTNHSRSRHREKSLSGRALFRQVGRHDQSIAMKRPLLFLTATFCGASCFAGPVVRVLMSDEQQPEQKSAYAGKFLGETIAAHLEKQPGISVSLASMASPEQGLDEATLDKTDVIIWWGHKRHTEVADAAAERVVARVREGKLALIALHSAHWSKPFVRLMQERAKTDAQEKISSAGGAAAKMEIANDKPIGRAVKADTPLTPSLEKTDAGWKLTLPQCVFPAWRADGAPSHMATLLLEHPIAKGLPAAWDIPHTEMYNEPFHVPPPDLVIFEEKWDKGERFRSGCLWNVDRGRVFYFRPGHETYAIYQQAEPLRVLENAVRTLSPLPVTGR
jgi:trehalose utilization protein